MSEEPAKSDIDFDELDKAVNSLMGKVGGETLEDSDKTKTLDINTTLKPDDKVQYDEIGKAAQKIGGESLVTDSEVELVEDLSKLPETMELPSAQPVASPEAAIVATPTPPKPTVPRPNSGRFMDMVNSKADMRSTLPLPNLVVPDRSGAGLTTASAPTAAPVLVTPVSMPASEAPATETPIATPFLSDAKVEKRPLGGTIINPITVKSDDEKRAITLETDETKESESTSDPVETESINSEGAIKTDNGSGDEQRALNASDFEKETATEEALTKIEATEASEPKVEEPQTIEKVESGDTESLKTDKNDKKDNHKGEAQSATTPAGAIYDTKEYHQPLAHPPKQKSGWGVVVVIIIVIILAVAIAGGAYLAFGFNK